MKILIAGDIHGNSSHLRYLTKVAYDHGAEKIFQVGDFGFWEHMPEGVEFLNKAEAWANISGVPVYFLDGNHDKTSLLLDRYTERDDEGFIIVREHIRYAPRGHQWTWDGTRFIALGGAYSVDKEYRLDLERQVGKPQMYWFPVQGGRRVGSTFEALDQDAGAAPGQGPHPFHLIELWARVLIPVVKGG